MEREGTDLKQETSRTTFRRFRLAPSEKPTGGLPRRIHVRYSLAFMKTGVWGAALAVAAAACGASLERGLVVEQASADHHCPKDKIAVIEEDASTYRVAVCGAQRRYRVREKEGVYESVDVTSESTSGLPPSKSP
jgi:hypothetical protein